MSLLRIVKRKCSNFEETAAAVYLREAISPPKDASTQQNSPLSPLSHTFQNGRCTSCSQKNKIYTLKFQETTKTRRDHYVCFKEKKRV